MGDVGSDLKPSLRRGRWEGPPGGGGNKEPTLRDMTGDGPRLPLSRELVSDLSEVGGAMGGVNGNDALWSMGGVIEAVTEVSGVRVFVGVASGDEKLAQLLVIGGGSGGSESVKLVGKVGGADTLKGGGVDGTTSVGWLNSD